MKKQEQLSQIVFQYLQMVPICSTPQIGQLCYSDVSYPLPAASRLLTSLENKKYVKGESRQIDKPKTWRLTKQAKERLGIKQYTVPLHNSKTDHYLKIGDILLQLYQSSKGKLYDFKTELREQFTVSNGKDLLYCPDAYFIWNQQAYLLEVQLTPLSSERWKRKWEIHRMFYETHLEKASWQSIPGYIIEPEIIVYSTQMEDTIMTGVDELPIRIIRDVKQIEDL